MSRILRVKEVYRVKSGRAYTRLKVRIDRRSYHVGQQVEGTTLWISTICADGEVIFTDSAAGVEFSVQAERTAV